MGKYEMKEKLSELLDELAQRTQEAVCPDLAEDIKRRIPSNLAPHRGRMDSINIIIDLRVGKLTAAAAIIITMILCVNFLDRRDSADGGLYQDSKMLVEYCLGTIAEKTDVSVYRARYEYLVQKGKEAAFYECSIDSSDSNAVLMEWKLSDGSYRVVFADLREKTVTAGELIKLQGLMLQKQK